MTTTDRAGYIAGGRELFDILEANPDLPLPSAGSLMPLTLFFHGNTAKNDLASALLAFPGTKAKSVRDNYFDVAINLHGLKVQLTALREQVCERVVTGTEVITREVPDPKVRVSMVTVTETVETVEWICSPLLSEVSA